MVNVKISAVLVHVLGLIQVILEPIIIEDTLVNRNIYLWKLLVGVKMINNVSVSMGLEISKTVVLYASNIYPEME